MKRRLGTVTALVVALIVGSTLFIAPGAQGAAPTRFSDTQVSLFCDDMQNASGLVQGLGASSSEAFGDFASLAFFQSGTSPETDPPTLSASFETPADVTGDDDSLAAQIPLVDAAGEPAGTATLNASLVPDGDPITIEGFRDGNRWIRQSGTDQHVIASGTLDLPDVGRFEFDGCSGDILHIDVFESNPDTFVATFSGLIVECDLETEDGFVSLFAINDSQGSFIDVTFFPASGGLLSGGLPDATVTTQQLSGTIPLSFESEGGGDAGEAVIDAVLTAGQRVNFSTRSSSSKLKVIGRLYNVAGSLTFSHGGERFDLSGCVAIDRRDQNTSHNPSGPKPGGKLLANDTLEGALPLAPGTSVKQATGGASPDPESPCTNEFNEEVPFGRTVWYTVAGTGGTVTIDTSASDFDTVLGAYTNGSGLTPIACIDDVPRSDFGFSLQSILTLQTEVGVTYYIQAGGFDGQFGQLRVRVS